MLWIRNQWLPISCKFCQLQNQKPRCSFGTEFWSIFCVIHCLSDVCMFCVCTCADFSHNCFFFYHTLLYRHLRKEWVIEGVLPSSYDPATISLSVSLRCLLACNLMRVPDVGRWSRSNPSFLDHFMEGVILLYLWFTKIFLWFFRMTSRENRNCKHMVVS